MTPKQFKEARHQLGLSVNQLAALLGVTPHHLRRMQTAKTASTSRDVPTAVAKLMQAYLAGYRPPDWPADLTSENSQ